MKKLTNEEMMNVNAGGTISYSDVCSGTWNAHKRRHDTTITGSGSTLKNAKIDHNKRLATHKVSGAMPNHTHSLDPVTV